MGKSAGSGMTIKCSEKISKIPNFKTQNPGGWPWIVLFMSVTFCATDKEAEHKKFDF